MQDGSGCIVLEGAHGELAWQKYTTDKGGGDSGGGWGPVTNMVSFPRVLKTVRFLVAGCPAVAHSAGRLRECTDTFSRV